MNLDYSIQCDTLEVFQKSLEKLSNQGYVDGRPGQVGANIYTLGMSTYHFNTVGYRYINVYDNKMIKYSCDGKGFKKNRIKIVNGKSFIKH